MLVGRPGISPVMVGREAELERLATLATGGNPPAVALVAGEAGIGKSRLVQELAAAVGPDVVLRCGQADPGALGRPFELLLDALDGGEANGEPGGADEGQLGARAIIADRDSPLDDRVAAGLDLVRRQAASAGRLVLVFEDLHWADSESVLLFGRLAEPASGLAMLIGTYRPDALTRRHPFADLLARLERRRAVAHLHLERLSLGDVRAFLAAVYGRSPSYRVVTALHNRTGGNPYFLEELLLAAGSGVRSSPSASGGATDPDEIATQPLPWTLSEVIRGQLDGLDAEQRQVIEIAAVLGRRVPFDLLAIVAGIPEGDLIPILRRLMSEGLLVEAENDVFSFRHALAREAVEAELLGRERRRVHEAALAALRAAGSDDLAAIAHHAQGAGRFDDMIEAARLGARSYFERGSTHQALQLAELGLSEAPDDLELLSIAARSAWLVGLRDDALAHAAHRLEVARAAGAVSHEAAALRRLIRLHWEAGDTDSMDRVAGELVALLDTLADPAERGRAMAAIAQGHMLRDRVDEAVAWADRAVTLADEHGLPTVRAWARVEKGSALIAIPGLVDTGAALLDEVADEAEKLGEWVVMARALNNRVRAELGRPSPALASALLSRMREAARRAGFDSLAGPAYWQGLADLAEWEGDLEAAIGHLEEGRRTDRGVLDAGQATWYSIHEAGLALELGDVDRADARRAEFETTPHQPSWYHGLVTHIAARRGDLDETRRALAELVIAAQREGTVDSGMVHDVVTACLRVGVGPGELEAFTSVPRLSEGIESERGPWSALIAAQLAEAAGRMQEALGDYEDACRLGGSVLKPAVLGSAHVAAARCLLAAGDLARAREHAEEAARLLARWSGPRVAELHAVQRRLGIGPSVPGPDSLTRREREVAALLAEGLSNADLAARLFISPKTAAVHVSNILAKLGMSGRTEVAAWAIRNLS